MACVSNILGLNSLKITENRKCVLSMGIGMHTKYILNWSDTKLLIVIHPH